MPTYSYVCSSCKHEYDSFQSMKADAHTECPECDGQVKRLIGAGAGILFKGSGFYVNDYRPAAKSDSDNAAPKSESKSSSDSKTNGAAGSSSSSDSKTSGAAGSSSSSE